MAQLFYELSFKGAATDTLAAAFQDCQVTIQPGVTVVRTSVRDQSALLGLLARVNELGLELLDVHVVAEPTAD